MSEPENILEASQQQAEADAAAKAAQHAANGTKPASETTTLAFGYDPAGAEALFGKPGEDGRPANIPAKYWDGDARKVKADVVFNQLRWAEGKLGQKFEVIGKPDGDYQINVPAAKEDEAPFEIDPADPAVRALFAVAKKHDVSQTFIDEVIAEVVAQIREERPATFKAEIAKLGDKAQERAQNLQDFVLRHLTKEQVASIAGMTTTADTFVALEALVKATGAPAFVPRDPQNRPADSGRMTVEQWNALNFEMIDRGGQQVRRRAVDPDFNARVEKLRDEVFGTERRDASGRPVTATGQPV